MGWINHAAHPSGEYFQTTIKCISEKERKGRIADLALRGFEVVRLFRKSDEFGQDASHSSRRSRDIGSKTTGCYGAVLRRSKDWSPNVSSSARRLAGVYSAE